jgi:hypothetical protein
MKPCLKAYSVRGDHCKKIKGGQSLGSYESSCGSNDAGREEPRPTKSFPTCTSVSDDDTARNEAWHGKKQRQGRFRVQSSEYGFLSVVNFPSSARRRDRNPSLGLRTHEIGLCRFVRAGDWRDGRGRVSHRHGAMILGQG